MAAGSSEATVSSFLSGAASVFASGADADSGFAASIITVWLIQRKVCPRYPGGGIMQPSKTTFLSISVNILIKRAYQ